MKVALAPGTILRWGGRRETLGEYGLIERIHIVDAENRPAPPGRCIARSQDEIDENFPEVAQLFAEVAP